MAKLSELVRRGELLMALEECRDDSECAPVSGNVAIAILSSNERCEVVGTCHLLENILQIVLRGHDEVLHVVFVRDDMYTHTELRPFDLVTVSNGCLDGTCVVLLRVHEFEREFEMLGVIVMNLDEGVGGFLISRQYHVSICSCTTYLESASERLHEEVRLSAKDSLVSEVLARLAVTNLFDFDIGQRRVVKQPGNSVSEARAVTWMSVVELTFASA